MFESDLLFCSAALKVTRATSAKGNIMTDIIHRSIILIYAVAGKVWEMPMKLRKYGQISNNVQSRYMSKGKFEKILTKLLRQAKQ